MDILHQSKGICDFLTNRNISTVLIFFDYNNVLKQLKMLINRPGNLNCSYILCESNSDYITLNRGYNFTLKPHISNIAKAAGCKPWFQISTLHFHFNSLVSCR